MGYRIVYGEDPFYKKPESHFRLRLMTAAFALVFVLLVRCCWPQGTRLLRKALLPGTQEAAFSRMAQEIRAGEPVGEAVTAFCRSVVQDALDEPG